MRTSGVVLFSCVVAVACGGSTTSTLNTSSCVAGSSIACTGAGGCTGFQQCKADGTGYDACECKNASLDGGATNDGAVDGGGGGGVDGGGDGGAGGDAGPWTPHALSGLSLWLDDDQGIGFDAVHPTNLLHWTDQSGRGNTASVVNASDNTFTIDSKVLNGHDAFFCQGGAALQVSDDPSLQWNTSDFAVAAVVRVDSQSQLLLYGKDSGGGNPLRLGSNMVGAFSMQVGGQTLAVGTGDGKFHVVVYEGRAMQIFDDATSAAGPMATADITNPGAAVNICQGGTTGNVEIAELIAVKGTLSTSDRTNLQTYLKTKFKL